MRTVLYLTVIFLCTNGISSCGPGKSARQAADSELYELLSEDDLFRFRERLSGTEALTPERRLFYEAFLYNYFNDKPLSDQKIEQLLTQYGESLPDSTIASVIQLKAANDLFMHRYAEASEACRELLERYSHVLDEEETEEIRNGLELWGTLSSVPPQFMEKHGDVRIASSRDFANFIIVPVSCNGTESGFVFDTGANLSTVTESTARRMGMTLYEAEVSVGTSTSIKVKSSLAVAERFTLGDIVFGNVVFLVMPDEMLSFPGYSIEGIIGMPLMVQLEELHIGRDGDIFVPAEPTDRGLRNLCFDGLMPVVEMFSRGDTITIGFDSGAKNTDFSERYFQRHKEYILEHSTYNERQRGGAGGNMLSKEYILNDFPFTIGSREGYLETVAVSAEDNDGQNIGYDGNLGQDIISQFDRMILNFKYMFIDFE